MSDEILHAVLNGMSEAATEAKEILEIELVKEPADRNEADLNFALGLFTAVTHALRQLRRSGEQ